VFLGVAFDEAAVYIRHFLRHATFRPQAQRKGKVVRVRIYKTHEEGYEFKYCFRFPIYYEWRGLNSCPIKVVKKKLSRSLLSDLAHYTASPSLFLSGQTMNIQEMGFGMLR
jgi:hypothetical protein